MDTIYPFILFCILCFPGISAEALLVVHKRAATVYHAVRKGLANNHITEYTLKHGRHVTRYLVLTPSGILFLQDPSTRRALSGMVNQLHGYPSELWWSEEIFLDEDDTLRFRVSGISTDYMLRVCGISAMNLFWNVAGASTAVTLLPETIDSPYCEAVRDAISAMYMYKMPTPFQNESKVIFEDVFSVKNRLAEIAAPELARAGRYSGVLVTEHTAYTVYSGSKDGMSWGPLARKRDLDAMDVYHQNLSPLKFVSGQIMHSIILVQNAKMFADLLLDAASKNRDRQGHIKYTLGEGYGSSVLFPLSYAGLKLARNYISADPNTAVKDLTRQIQQPFFPEATITLPYSMQAVHYENEIYQLIYMNAHYIFSLIQTYQNNSFEILCLDWQVDFYGRLFDFVTFKNCFELDGLQIVYAEVRTKPEIAGLFLPFSNQTNHRTTNYTKSTPGNHQLPNYKKIWYIP